MTYSDETIDVISNNYWDWIFDPFFFLVPAQTFAAEFLGTFKEFPPRQKAASFKLESVTATTESNLTGG
ncbi:MAG: hypothetical protein ACRC2J_09570 [Microcoleaceae cyanobacterium]